MKEKRKVLFSWLAFTNDFVEDTKEINENGISVEFYRYHYKQKAYDEHILLRTADMKSVQKANLLSIYLKQEFDFVNIDIQEVDINDFMDINEIKNKVELLLLKYRESEVDLMIGAGTALMQLVWYFLHESTDVFTRLIQPVRKEYWEDKKKPKLVEIQLKKSPEAYAFALLNQEHEKKDKQIYLSKSLKKVYDKADQIALVDGVAALVLGASGTGKELIVKYIHSHSARQDKPYIAINCAAMQDNLLESRLFGYKKGAFTGADKDQKGILKSASGGVVFLDEIGDISPYMQAALLRFLQEGELFPIGANEPEKTNVRIIAATNKNLEEMCKKGEFRWDLYYRLAVAVIKMPSFETFASKERRTYLNFLVEIKQKALGKKQKLQFSPKALEIIDSYSFPGNFRELENLIEQLYVFVSDEVKSENLPDRMWQKSSDSELSMDFAKKQQIIKVLKIFDGNLTRTSKVLGISLNTLKNNMKEYEIRLKKTWFIK